MTIVTLGADEYKIDSGVKNTYVVNLVVLVEVRAHPVAASPEGFV